MTDRTYDTLKFIALLISPIIVFASSCIDIWAIPYGPQIIKTLAALDVAFGAIVTIAKAQWEKRQK